MVSGASPLSPEVMDFLRICFPGVQVLEGYGMTESSCTIAVSMPEDTQVQLTLSNLLPAFHMLAVHVSANMGGHDPINRTWSCQLMSSSGSHVTAYM